MDDLLFVVYYYLRTGKQITVPIENKMVGYHNGQKIILDGSKSINVNDPIYKEYKKIPHGATVSDLVAIVELKAYEENPKWDLFGIASRNTRDFIFSYRKWDLKLHVGQNYRELLIQYGFTFNPNDWTENFNNIKDIEYNIRALHQYSGTLHVSFVPPEINEIMPDIETLFIDISGSHHSNPLPKTLEGLTKLKNLTIVGNDFIFPNFNLNLERLVLNGVLNPIIISAVVKLLTIRNCKDLVIPGGNSIVIENCENVTLPNVKIRNLTVRNCKLLTLPDEISVEKRIIFKNCNLTKIPELKGEFETVDLSNNFLTELPQLICKNFIISNNKIEKIDVEETNFDLCDLSNNSIKNFNIMKGIKKLILDDNPGILIENFPKDLIELSMQSCHLFETPKFPEGLLKLNLKYNENIWVRSLPNALLELRIDKDQRENLPEGTYEIL